MKFETIDPPRKFKPAGPAGPEISHTANVELQPDEQVTFTTASGGEVDFVRKSWGFYPLPSLNGRLPRFDLFPALAVNSQGDCYLLLVEAGKKEEFESYIRQENMTVIAWLGEREPD